MTLKFKHDILVRNNRIEQMQAEGCKIKYRVLTDEEYIQCLRQKLIDLNRVNNYEVSPALRGFDKLKLRFKLLFS